MKGHRYTKLTSLYARCSLRFAPSDLPRPGPRARVVAPFRCAPGPRGQVHVRRVGFAPLRAESRGPFLGGAGHQNQPPEGTRPLMRR